MDVPSPGDYLGRGIAPLQIDVLIFDLKMVSFGAFWVVFCVVSKPGVDKANQISDTV